MSKIICDVCGTSYPDSATQCPICGCVRPVDIVEAHSNDINAGRSGNYTYVKGGRFSRTNVQKRNQGLQFDEPVSDTTNERKSAPVAEKSDKGLVIAVCALLLAIIAVAVYIVIHFFAAADEVPPKTTDPATTAAIQTTVDTTPETTVETNSCTDVVLSQTEVTFTSAGESLSLGVFFTPSDTTDELQFVSENPSVATVSDLGEIVAVGSGETKVIVTCGESSAQCAVICQFENDDQNVTDTEPTRDVESEYKAPFKINKTDVSISVGETFQLKVTDSNGNAVPVTWSATIADICKIEGTAVTGADKGKTELSATYNGETFTCIVRVR